MNTVTFTKNQFLLFLAVVFAVIIMTIFVTKSMSSGKSKIDALAEQNKVLKQQNKELLDKNVVLLNKVDSVSTSVDRYAQLEKTMLNNYNQIKSSINNLKPKYEAAATFSNNFNADSIRQYFSNLR
jgi:uncharacterized protein YoxC